MLVPDIVGASSLPAGHIVYRNWLGTWYSAYYNYGKFTIYDL